MKRKFEFHLTQLVIDVMMKVAGVLVTSVATWRVAQHAFDYLEEPWLTVVSIGALLLVEGAFLAAWLAIDTQKQAPPSLKVAWSVTLITIYAALLVLALAHGEGSAGWAFRFVLAVMIGRSIYEAGVYELIKTHRATERNVKKAYVVRRLERKHARANAIKAMYASSEESSYVRELQDVVERARLEAEHEVAMMDTKLYRDLLLERVYAKDTLSRGQILAKLAKSRERKTQKKATLEAA